MPTSGPVYQPTTVSYEQQNEWSRPGSYLSQTMNSSFRSPRCVQWLILACAIFLVGSGFIILIEGTVEFTDNLQTRLENEHGEMVNNDSSASKLGFTIIGIIMILIGLVLFVLYGRILVRRKECPCYPSKEERLAMHLESQGGNGQIHTMNPSTDLLVATQYGPVSETYQPPVVVEHEETHKLMAANDTKDGLNETRSAPLAILDDASLSICSSNAYLDSIENSWSSLTSRSPSYASTSSTLTPRSIALSALNPVY